MDPIVKRLLENKNKENELSSSEGDYSQYLQNHKDGVRKYYKEIMLPLLIDEGIDDNILTKIEELINNHDASKYDAEEFTAYSNYFYDNKNNSRSSEEFNLAWNHHQKHNPHHWNYWVLINDVDKPQVQALDMPLEYVVEMLCDWQSAGLHYSNTAYEWYEKQGSKMILSSNTKKLVDKYIGHFK